MQISPNQPNEQVEEFSSTQVARAFSVALAGNPNSGKSALFNRLTGSNQKTANFPGVTVEKKQGTIDTTIGRSVEIIDLPGTYSIDAESPDEVIAQRILLGLEQHTKQPDAILVVIDSTHFERSLFLLSQLMEFGLKIVVCMNMYDLVEKRGMQFDLKLISSMLGAPVIPTVAVSQVGQKDIQRALNTTDFLRVSKRPFKMSPKVENLRDDLAKQIATSGVFPKTQADFWAGKIITGKWRHFGDDVTAKLADIEQQWRKEIEQLEQSETLAKQEIAARYVWLDGFASKVIQQHGSSKNYSDKIDALALHPLLGPALFVGLMLLVFQSVFSWAGPAMDLIDSLMGGLSGVVTNVLPESMLRDLLVDGIIAGIGAVVIFIPQIAILFLFVHLLESSGYMARAAFLVDRIMVRSGLTGRSFIPLLSSFACAIPGIMATRTIKNERDRLTTIMVAPLMTCSARLPVYALLIGAFVPATLVFGFRLQGLVLFGLYLLGVLGAVVAAKVFRKTLIQGSPQLMVIELPDYKWPRFGDTLRYVWTRIKLFLKRAGKIILVASMILWALATFPKNEALEKQLRNDGMSDVAIAKELTRQSYAGKLGSLVEPVIAPLGYDWKVGVSLLASFAAREVFVATMGTIYNIEDVESEATNLEQALAKDVNPRSGGTLFNLPMVLGLLVFFAFAMQCVSTIAVIRRETNSWKWPMIAVGYTYTLAYLAALFTYKLSGWLISLPT